MVVLGGALSASRLKAKPVPSYSLTYQRTHCWKGRPHCFSFLIFIFGISDSKLLLYIISLIFCWDDSFKCLES